MEQSRIRGVRPHVRDRGFEVRGGAQEAMTLMLLSCEMLVVGRDWEDRGGVAYQYIKRGILAMHASHEGLIK